MRAKSERVSRCFIEFFTLYFAIASRNTAAASFEYQQLLRRRRVFFATLKLELTYESHWHTRTQARSEIFEYIELFYNRQLRHSPSATCVPMNSNFDIIIPGLPNPSVYTFGATLTEPLQSLCYPFIAFTKVVESETEPKTPPCILIILTAA
jgi:hypothetical protein